MGQRELGGTNHLLSAGLFWEGFKAQITIQSLGAAPAVFIGVDLPQTGLTGQLGFVGLGMVFVPTTVLHASG